MDIIQILSEELQISKKQIENTVALIDEGNTIPFIARYRKEVTGGLDDTVLRKLGKRLEYLRNLAEKKEDVIRIITEQGKMTDEILASIEKASTMQEMEDIYRPFRPKRRTRATMAKEKGLEPLAQIILMQLESKKTLEELASEYITEEVPTAEEALAGARDIIAESVSDDADKRKAVREFTYKNGIVASKATKEEESVYSGYYEFSESVNKIANHRILAINRGEKEEFLSVKIEVDEEAVVNLIKTGLVIGDGEMSAQVALAVEDSYERLIAPSIEREIRNILTERAQEKSIELFSKNLKQLLLAPPISGKNVLGLDPGYRTGCKVAVVDFTGKVLDTDVIYCTLDHHDKDKAKKTVINLINKHNVDIVAIGNGTASKESEIFVAGLLGEVDRDVKYIMVSEAGASVYSASEVGAAEFPDYDVALRSAVSIARRLEDPLAELVKIDPKSIGVGQYQHDMNQKNLESALGGVVEDCVNSVGVDVNTASPHLLSYVAGINSSVAANIVAYREENGVFTDRKQFKKVSKLGDKAFLQCAGFMRITGGKMVLDNTAVHPESYELAKEILESCGYSLDDVKNGNLHELKKRANRDEMKALAEKHGVGMPTVEDIISELLKPGRDPRENLDKPVLRSDLMSIENLKPGMVLAGTVRNITDFGAFVDIGVHQDGLVHISQISEKFVKHPMDILSVGDVRKVKIVDIDVKKGKIALSMRNVDE
ncbi:MAG: RNA-binding transcriptional accessory protein [Clostridia bacterium]|nr:RNA-binding transcriptional accessory protein [Clostridia bacterium]